MEKTLEVLKQIKGGRPFEYQSEGKQWRISKSGARFQISHDKSSQKRLVPERAIQRILNNIL